MEDLPEPSQLLTYNNQQLPQLSQIPSQNKQLQQFIKKQLQQSALKLQGGTYDYYNCERVFRTAKCMPSQKITLRRNYKPLILNDILKISFPNLMELDISQNYIISVESLMLLQAPRLQSLSISHNRITSLRAIRKLPFAFKKLQFDGNPMNQLTFLDCIHFQSNVKSLSLQAFQSRPCIGEDLSIIMKLEFKTLDYLSTYSSMEAIKKRLNNSVVVQYLKLRMPSSHQLRISGVNR